MGKLFYIMGKSASGKDTIYQRLLRNPEFSLERLVIYTTRPIRDGELDGREYHFVTEEDFQKLKAEGKIIEDRGYETVYGLWRYFTADNMNLEEKSYLGIGTLESYEKLKAWTANFEEEFVKWSPYHIECNLYNGNYNAGSKIRFREIVMGLDYDVTGTITECEQDENHFRIVFRSDKKTAFITFEGKRTKTGCHFSHTEAFGMTTPVIGAIMNFLIFKVFFRKKANWQLIRDDMILDNRYLYDILTEGKYPERIPLDKLLTGA